MHQNDIGVAEAENESNGATRMERPCEPLPAPILRKKHGSQVVNRALAVAKSTLILQPLRSVPSSPVKSSKTIRISSRARSTVSDPCTAFRCPSVPYFARMLRNQKERKCGNVGPAQNAEDMLAPSIPELFEKPKTNNALAGLVCKGHHNGEPDPLKRAACKNGFC